MFSFSLYNIIKWNIDTRKTNEEIDDLVSTTTVEKIKDNSNTEIIEQDVPKEDLYWDFITYDLINVNFTELQEKNPDTVAWIQVNGTNINYPVVKGSDNDFYLTHSFNQTWNEAGWVFMDYRNTLEEDKNTIIYAHARLDKSMFGSLKKVINDDWLSDTSNYVVKLSTPYENTLWQVFSVYRIPTTSDYLTTVFYDDDDFNTFTSMLINRSVKNFNTPVNSTDRILTLSTCYNSSDKVVLHAKLIKREIRN
jgi:sortase B